MKYWGLTATTKSAKVQYWHQLKEDSAWGWQLICWLDTESNPHILDTDSNPHILDTDSNPHILDTHSNPQIIDRDSNPHILDTNLGFRWFRGTLGKLKGGHEGVKGGFTGALTFRFIKKRLFGLCIKTLLIRCFVLQNRTLKRVGI